MRVAVAGGTGLVGTMVVAELGHAGHDPVVLSRSRGVDLTTGTGLPAALDGCSAVIDVSNVSTVSRRTAVEFFTQETGHLLAASRQAGVSRLIVLSIVGACEADMGYYAGKRVQEEQVTAGPLPWTILRATQFHEFPGQRMTGWSPVIPVPRVLCQPVAAAEVAAALVQLAQRSPAGFATPIAGPERLHLVDMARQLARARGERRLVLPLPLPGAAGKALANGGLLPEGKYIKGKQTFAGYLAGVQGAARP